MKKKILIFIVGVLLPLFVAFIQLSSVYFSYNRLLFGFLFWIPILSNIYIFYINYSTKAHNLFWYILTVIFGLGSLALLYSFNSLSNFGF